MKRLSVCLPTCVRVCMRAYQKETKKNAKKAALVMEFQFWRKKIVRNCKFTPFFAYSHEMKIFCQLFV